MAIALSCHALAITTLGLDCLHQLPHPHPVPFQDESLISMERGAPPPLCPTDSGLSLRCDPSDSFCT